MEGKGDVKHHYVIKKKLDEVAYINSMSLLVTYCFSNTSTRSQTMMAMLSRSLYVGRSTEYLLVFADIFCNNLLE